MKSIFKLMSIIIVLASCDGAKKVKQEKPNVIFIMLDDFCYSQIGYNSEQISKEDYDPLFLQYTLENRLIIKCAMQETQRNVIQCATQ